MSFEGRLDSIDNRLVAMQEAINIIHYKVGEIEGKLNNGNIPLILKYVVFPLICIVGAITGIKIIPLGG